MTNFNLYNKQNAPEKSAPLLEKLESKYGFVPNIFAHMAESPLPIELYSFGQDLVNAKGTLSSEEVNIVQLATSVENECEFCVPAHSTLARHNFKTDDAVIDAIRDGIDGPDSRVNALVNFTKSVTAKRGHVSDNELNQFLSAGFTKEQIFEVLTIVAYKVLTNYTSAIADTRPNPQFAGEAWTAPSKRNEAA